MLWSKVILLSGGLCSYKFLYGSHKILESIEALKVLLSLIISNNVLEYFRSKTLLKQNRRHINSYYYEMGNFSYKIDWYCDLFQFLFEAIQPNDGYQKLLTLSYG